MKKNMIVIFLLLGLVVYGGYDYYSKSVSDVENASVSERVEDKSVSILETGIQKGQIAPDFTLYDLNGNPVKLSELKGKKVLINFWATWCPPCRAEMPQMQKFYEDYKSESVAIVGVNLTPTEENTESIQSFVGEHKLTFPIVLDPEGDVMQKYQIAAYPTTYLLDSTGVIRGKFQGAINYELMKESVSNIK